MTGDSIAAQQFPPSANQDGPEQDGAAAAAAPPRSRRHAGSAADSQALLAAIERLTRVVEALPGQVAGAAEAAIESAMQRLDAAAGAAPQPAPQRGLSAEQRAALFASLQHLESCGMLDLAPVSTLAAKLALRLHLPPDLVEAEIQWWLVSQSGEPAAGHAPASPLALPRAGGRMAAPRPRLTQEQIEAQRRKAATVRNNHINAEASYVGGWGGGPRDVRQLAGDDEP